MDQSVLVGGAGTAAREGAPRLVGVVWALLVVNALGSLRVDTIVPIPKPVLQGITMGSLVVAFALALLLNPRIRIRANSFLLLLTLLLAVSVASSSTLESGLGSLFRCARMAVFVATLWLISCWWDGSLEFVRHHLRILGLVLGSVALGLVLAPGLARPASFDNRLLGVIWPITSTQVADDAAVVAGLVVVLWLARYYRGRSVGLVVGASVVLLVLTHTRTALLAMVAGIAVAALTLITVNTRVRRVLLFTGVVSGLVGALFAAPLTSWFQRGQDTEALTDLTGRQKTWDKLLAAERTLREQLFGVGLTDKSFDGLSIDSTWLAVYHEQGLVGVALVALIMGGMAFSIAVRPPSPQRACAAFLLVYGLIASYTQTGLGDVSSYLLHFVLAAALLSGSDAPDRPEPNRPVTV